MKLNLAQLNSMGLKVLTFVAGAAVAFSLLTPDQAAAASEHMTGLLEHGTKAAAAALALYQLVRSWKAHKNS